MGKSVIWTLMHMSSYGKIPCMLAGHMVLMQKSGAMSVMLIWMRTCTRRVRAAQHWCVKVVGVINVTDCDACMPRSSDRGACVLLG